MAAATINDTDKCHEETLSSAPCHIAPYTLLSTMTTWEGANVAPRSRSEGAVSRANQETVEAALNRLSKGYQTAIQCIAAWHRADSSLDIVVMTKVGRAARNAFEEGLLLDPLVMLYASQLTGFIGFQNRREPPVLSSAAHKELVKKLAYLSLVNFSDMLISGCFSSSPERNGCSLLDRGVVQVMKSFGNARASCWDENEERTVRMALLALLDASTIDQSDPILWLKQACLARRLGRLLDASGTCLPAFLLHRRLEKHALEMGLMSLPTSVPPSRLVQKAAHEWNTEEYPELCPAMLLDEWTDSVANKTRIVISRYNSWSTVAKTLLRVVRSGSPHLELHLHQETKARRKPVFLGSVLEIDVAPIITLPSGIIGFICAYLTPRDQNSLEATCKELSISVVSVRAAMDHSKTVSAIGNAPMEAEDIVGQEPETESKNDDQQAADTPSNRSSKRLRTQIMTEGKRAERLKRRQSIEYCLRSVVFQCDPESGHFKEMLPHRYDWERDFPAEIHLYLRQASALTPQYSILNASSRLQQETKDRLSNSSLCAFLSIRWPISSIGMLFRFLSHVSHHVGNVFASDRGSSTILASTLSECIETLLSYSKYQDALTPCWSNGDLVASLDSKLSLLDLFAIDVLHGELLLKRIERLESHTVHFDSDGNKLTLLISTLQRAWENAEPTSSLYSHMSFDFVPLKARFLWLNARYFLWRSRASHVVSESRNAEIQALQRLDECIELLKDRNESISIPHLDFYQGVNRTCSILSASSLKAFRNEVQASSVILLTQERFLDAISKVTSSAIVTEAEGIAAIGNELLERYASPVGCWDAKYLEIIEDFVNAYQDTLLRGPEEGLPYVSIHDWFDALVPATALDGEVLRHLANSPTVTILSILSTCIVIKKEPAALLDFYGRLIITIGVICLSKIDRRRQPISVIKMGDNELDDVSLDDEDDDFREASASLIDRLRQYAVLLRLLWAKSQSVLANEKGTQLPSEFCASPLMGNMVRMSLNLCAKWFQYPYQGRGSIEDAQEDLMIFVSVSNFIKSIDSHCNLPGTLYRDCVLGFANVISTQTLVLLNIVDTKTGQEGRYVRQRLAKMRCDLIAGACCEFGRKLSELPYGMSEVFLEDWRNSLHDVCESLFSLWKTALANELHTKDRLLVPVATAVASLSGFAGTFPIDTLSSDRRQSMQDFYDSDGSAADYDSDDDNSNRFEKDSLLQCLGQIVYAINSVFSIIEDDAVALYGYYDAYITEHGPLLALVVTRVLNRVADTLLLKFCDDDDEVRRRKAIWYDYPYGTRTIGTLLDNLLYKAYKCLHLFVLTPNNESKDATSVSSTSLKTKQFMPESLDAAAALYRCITRAYSQGRRAPPKVALDTVLAALPVLSSEQGDKIDSIWVFLFSTGDQIDLADLETIVNQAENWEVYFQSLDAVCHQATTTADEEDVAVLVRAGISELLAQGALPETGGDQDLFESAKTEEDLAKKFQAVLDDLCLRDTRDFRGWYKAAQCLMAKANFIADRIGLISGFSRSSDFTVPKRPRITEIGLDLTKLHEQQSNEHEAKKESWVDSLGGDLSIFVRSSWSSFSSLESCAAEIGSYYNDVSEEDEEHLLLRQAYMDLSTMYTKKDFAQWRQAWGGLFVSALRIIATRCLCLAAFFLSQNDQILGDSRGFMSKIMESLGILLYSEISGSQTYGYPMHSLTQKRKRDVAQAALRSFAKATTAAEKDDDQQQAWDLYFMLGKCHEKIASTFRKENFGAPQGITSTFRQYELHMRDALCNYSRSLNSALLLEKRGQLNSDQEGGSEHGSAEALYRLHATRLKCLIYAVAFRENERELAEKEALRLTEAYWFSRPEDYPNDLSTRDRVWAVLSDIVDALARCRLGHSFFHRSVYRHAQALLWAPVLDNPTAQWTSGSLGNVSASKAAKIRGLNSSNAVSSAATIMNALFEKRRTQLCAVWMTTGSGSPFATLNQVVRKYDSLRGKYISAYLDTLLLCDNRDSVESFIKLVYGARRDLPSFFAASAEALGAIPRENHSNETLLQTDESLSSNFFLTTTKRQANGCLASIIYKEIRSSRSTTSIAKENNLKTAYSCYLRLNSTAEGLVKYVRSSNYLRNSDATRAVVSALTEAYVQVHGSSSVVTSEMQADWSNESQLASLLQASLTYCKKTFPNLSGNYYSKKPAPTKKRKREPDAIVESNLRKSFDVKVPEGAKAGDSFIVSVMVAGQVKKVRLTVPVPVPTIMRFSLPLPLPSAQDSESNTDINDSRN